MNPVARALARAAGVLPDQGPIGVFVHHNTLHAFQHLPFHEGVQAGADALGAEPYLSLARFREAFRAGRVDDADVRAGIVRTLGLRGAEPVLRSYTRAELWHLLTVTEADADDAAGLAYLLQAGIARECEDLPLWSACLARAARGPWRPAPAPARARRHRDVLVALGGDDTDVPVHGELVRLGAGFLDHGHARVTLPARDRGFLAAVSALYAAGASAPRACAGAEAAMREVAASGQDADAVIRAVLPGLGVEDDDIEPFVFATALALPGWGGMFARLERHPGEHPGAQPPTLAEFVAVRLLLEREAVRREAARLDVPADWRRLRRMMPAPPRRPAVLDAALLWWVAASAGLDPETVAALGDDELAGLWAACAACPPIERRRLMHEAYERTYRRGILDAFAARRSLPPTRPDGPPRAQFVFCIDEREESMRRALEEQRQDYVTFGAAGFFGVAIDYQGLYDREPAAHCPVVVTPAHEVHEQAVYSDLGWHATRLRLRDRWHAWERRAASSSRTLSGGAGLSLLLGPLSGLRTMAHVLAPRGASVLAGRVMAAVAPRPSTRLSTLRDTHAPYGAAPGGDAGKPVGFSLEESADRVAAVLRGIGLTDGFAPVVVLLGHGSTSLNNPHESAHDCGACGGRRGGANARLLADMANRPDVRAAVTARGVAIPSGTWFVGALHDTADDSVKYYDLDVLPATHVERFEEVYQALERARRESARERCRRFDDVPLDVTADEALRRVEARTTHLAQPRPEYGHCTNAICFVGRREVIRGLHLDRRAFLVSYDPPGDTGNAVLERTLAAVGPVGAGISLEYYFSAVDNETFGCGTKLPHNVTGLIGVMNGHQSDLRTGLPLQMVEIHEPMRLLLIVEATPAALLAVASRQPEVAELVTNAWVQLVSMHPETGALAVFEDGGFVAYDPTPTLLPVVDRSADWHMRSREHLPPALVRRALPDSVVGPVHQDAARPVETVHG
ncbi:MAG: putative inorganic carbon transporter subunit DabA [Vicinamibacterales bacterium]